MESAIDMAKGYLEANDCTLVVVNGKEVILCHNRGVIDLVNMLDDDRQLLRGASVADKVIGKAAAALMITGGVREVFSRVITKDAIGMLEKAQIPVEYGQAVSFVQNRDKTGRCPLDTICAPLQDTEEMVLAINDFVKNKK